MKVFQHVSDIGDLKKALDEAFEIKADRYKYQSLGKPASPPKRRHLTSA